MNLLRSASALVLASAALAASAQVQYVFGGTSPGNGVSPSQAASFSLLSPTFITATTTIPASALQSASFAQGGTPYAVTSVQLTFAADTSVLVQIGTSGGSATQNGWAFGPASTTTYGPHAQTLGGPANLNVNPAPEPSALAALGLGAVAFVKRRKRA